MKNITRNKTNRIEYIKNNISPMENSKKIIISAKYLLLSILIDYK